MALARSAVVKQLPQLLRIKSQLATARLIGQTKQLVRAAAATSILEWREYGMEMVFCRGCGKQLHRTALACPNCGAQQVVDVSRNDQLKSQSTAGLWCVFLGGFGAHWFYLRKTAAGVLSLLFFWTGIPEIIAWVNGIQITFADSNQWARKYNNGVLTPPTHWAVKVAAIVLPVLTLLFWVAIFGSDG